MCVRCRLILSVLAVLLGAALSGVTAQALGVWTAQTALDWPSEENTAAQASIFGRYPDSQFGGTLAVGDVNGDGFDDLITNDRFASEIVHSGGEVYVIPGPLSLGESYTMPHGAALVFQGVSGYQPQVGVYLDAGDMNGDGLDDIVIGSWTSGQAYVYLGSSDIQASSPVTIPVVPENMALTVSPAPGGFALCDLNGDGYQDLFIEDFDKTPPHLQKYFLQFQIERLRGMLSVFQLIGNKRGDSIKVTSDELKELAQEIAGKIAKVGKRYEKTEVVMNRESLHITIYSEALKEIMTESKWKDFFDLIIPNENKPPRAR